MGNQRRGCAAVKEGGRILATAFLSLLPPLSFLLLARLSAARYFSSTAIDDHRNSFLKTLFLRSKTTLILSFLLLLLAIEALARALNGNKPTFVVSERRRSCAAWVLIFVVQVCLSLGIHGTVDAELSGFAAGDLLVLLRRAVFVLGLHEMTLLWRRSAVAPVVDETVDGVVSREGVGWVGEAVLAATFANLWWRRLRDEVEALVEWTWVGAELEAADAVGWLLYYLAAVIGGVRVVKGFTRVVTWIFRYRRLVKKNGVNISRYGIAI